MANGFDEYLVALDNDANDIDALASLERALTGSERWAQLVDVVAGRAAALTDTTQQARFLARSAFVARHYVGDEALADRQTGALTHLDISGADLVSGMTLAFAPDADWMGLVSAFMDAVEHAPNDVVRASLFHAAGRCYEDRLYDRERAITCYQRAFKLNPLATEPLHAARAIYAHADQWSTVARLYAIELQVTQEPRARARLLKELGHVQLDRLAEHDAALGSFREAVSLDADLESLNELVRELEGRAGAPAQGVFIDDSALQVTDTHTAVEATEESAEESAEESVDGTSEERDAEGTEAAEETAEEAAEEHDEQPADEEHDDVAEDGADEARAEETVDVVAVSDDDGADEASEPDAIDDEAEEAADDDVDIEVESDESAVAEGDAAEEADADEAEGAASEHAEVAASESPQAEAEAEADTDFEINAAVGAAPVVSLELHGQDVDNWVQARVDAAREAGGDAFVSLMAQAMDVAVRTGSWDASLADWVIEAAMEASDSLAAVQSLLPPLAAHAPVWADVAQRLKELDDGDSESGLAGALYGALFYGLHDVENAARYARRAGPVASMESAALEFAVKGNWRKTQTVLQDALGDEHAAYRAQTFVALGMDNVDKAIDSLRRVLRQHKDDVPALRFISQLYLHKEQWNALADAAKKRATADADLDDAGKALIYRDLVSIYRDHLQQDLQVVNSYQSLLEVDPTNVGVMDELAGRLEQMGRFPDLVEVLRRKAEAVDGDAERIAILKQVASIFIERFSNQAEAIKAYEQILEIEADDHESLVALEDAYEKRREWDKLIAVKQRLVDHASDPAAQAALLRDAAEIAATRKRDNEQAVSLWNDVLALAPDDDIALSALEHLYERDKDWVRLAEVLTARVTVLTDNDERAAALLKLGQIQGDRLDETEAALEAYEQLLELDPENFRAREAVKKAYVDLERWDSLEAFFARDAAWAEYVRQLESLAGSVDNDDTRIDLLFRAADVWVERLDDVGRATKDLERVLQIDEGNRDAAARLAPTYEERGDFRRLPATLEILLGHEEAPEARFELESRLARIHVEHLRDEVAGARWFCAALGEQPARVDICDELEACLEKTGTWTDAETLYEDARGQIAGAPEHVAEWRDLTLRLARVHDERLAQPDEALACLDDVLAHDPGDATALDAKDVLFTRFERWDELLEVVSAKADAADDVDARIGLLKRICEIHELHRDDVAAAIDRYNEVLSLRSADPDALDALHRLYRQVGDHVALAEVLGQLEMLHPRESSQERWLAIELELAAVLADELGEHARAVSVLREVVGVAPDNVEARAQLEAMLEVDGERHAAALLLEPLYEKDEVWAPLVGVLELRLEFERDGQTQAGLLSRIGAVQMECLEDATAAADAYARLLRVDPTSSHARARLEQLAAASGDWAGVVELYESVLDEVAYRDEDGKALAVNYARTVAGFYDTHLNDLDDAIRMQRRVLELAPGTADAHEALDDLYTRSERWEDLLQVCQERLDGTSDAGARRSLLFKAAGIWEQMLEEPVQAIGEYRRVLELSADDAEALEALDRLYGETDDPAARAEVVFSRAAAAGEDTAEGLALRNRLARIYERDLSDVPTALSLWSDVLAADPTNLEAESALREQVAAEDFAAQAAGVLEPLYVAQGRHGELVELLRTRLTYVDDAAERGAVYGRIASLQEEELGNAASAYHTLELALAEFPADSALFSRLYGLAGALGRQGALGDRAEALAADVDDPTTARGLLVQVARLRERDQGDGVAAADLWRQVLDIDAYDREAIDALERLYDELGEHASLVEMLLRKAELPDIASNVSARKAILFRAAARYEEPLGEVDEAIEVLRLVLQTDPSDEDAIEQLERLYTQTERWEDLVENYERKLAMATDDATRRQLYFALAAVLEREIDDPDRAIGAYRAILAFRPEDLEALRALDRLLIRTESWLERLEVLQAQATLVSDPEQALQLKYAVGRLYEGELGSPADAVATYSEVLAADPTHEDSRAALHRMIDRGEETGAAASVLEPIYRSESRWDAVVAVLRTRIEGADLPDERRALHVDAATLYEQQLGDQMSALASWTAAARESADHATLDHIERLAAECDAHERIVPLFLELWDDAVDPGMRTDIGLRVAAIRRDRIGDLDGAVEAFVRVHEEDPSEPRALLALDRLYDSMQRYEALADVLQKRTYVATDAAEARTLRLRLADIAYTALNDAPEAVNVYREVLQGDPTNATAIDALETMVRAGVEVYDIATTLDPIYREHAWWDRLVALNEARVRADDSSDERYRLWLDTAEVRERHLDDPQGTMVAVGRALQERPSDEALKNRIEVLAGGTDEWRRAAAIYASVLELDLEDSERFDTALRLATIVDERLGDPSGAEAAYVQALDVEPGASRALEALDRMYLAQERWDDLSSVIGRLREVVYDQPALVALTFRHAVLKRDRLDDVEGAIAAFNDVLEIDPTHGRALSALVSLYQASGAWDELYETYERQSQLSTDESERVAILERMAAVAADQLGRSEDAIDLWRQVLAARPDDATALEHLAWLFGETEQYAELADVFDRQIAQADDERRVELLRSAGALWADALDNPDMAIQRYRAVHELVPDDAPAFAALRGLYETVGDHASLVAVLDRMLELGLIDEDEQPSVYQQLGELYGDVLGLNDRAIGAWKSRLALVPSDTEALDRLDALYTQEAQWGPCVEVLESKLGYAEDDADRVDLLKRIGGLWLDQLNDREKGANAYERILDLDLADFDAQSSLERLYAELGSWDAMVGLYLDRLEITEDPWERLQCLRNAARVYEEQLSQTDGAYLIMAKAADEAPLDEEVLAELERLAAAADKRDDLAAQYTRLIARVAEDPTHGEEATLPLLLAVGRLQDEGLGRPMLAEPYYDRALGLDPENETALVALESVYERIEEWDSLVSILKRRANLTFDATEQVGFYRRVGQLYETRLDDLTEATEAYRMVVRLDDTDADALGALERIYEAAGQWRELVEVLSRRAENTFEPAPLVALKFRIGRLWRENLDNAERAIEAFKDVLGVQHDHRDALLQLESLYAGLDKWEKYLDTVESRLAIATDPDEQKEIYFAQAQVYERCFDDVDSAVASLNNVLMLDPRDLGAIEELERLFVEQERWIDLVDTYERHADAVSDGGARCAVLATMAQTFVDSLDDVYRALDTYNRILAIDPVHRLALERLGSLYEYVEDAPKAIDAYEKLAEVIPTPSDRVPHLFRAGELYEGTLGDLATAEARYLGVVEASDGTHGAAYAALQRVYMTQERWPDAIDMLQAQIEHTRDLTERANYLVQIAAINEEHVGNTAAATRMYEDALELDPGNIYAAEALVEMYIQAEKWERARSAIEVLIGSDAYAKDDDTLIALHTRLGHVNERLGADDDAIVAYEYVLELDSTQLDALIGLAGLYRRHDRRDEAYEILRELLSAHRDAMARSQTVELFFQAAELKRESGEGSAARDMYERALEYDDKHLPSLRALVDIVEAGGDLRATVTAKQRLLDVTTDDTHRLKLFIDVGDGLKELGDNAGAEQAFRSAVALDPESKTVLHKLLDTFSDAGNWRRAVEVLGKLASIETDPVRKSRYCFGVGAIFRDELGEMEHAIEWFNQALDANSAYLDPFEAIDKLFTEAREWKSLERAYRKMIERVAKNPSAESAEVRFVLVRNLGEIYRSRMQDPQRAIDAYTIAAQMKPDDAGILEILADLYARANSSGDEVVKAHQKLISVSNLRIESYQALFRAYLQQREFDRAWCMAAALTVLQRATPEEEEFYKRYLPQDVQQARRPLSPEHLTALAHEDLDSHIGHIFGMLATNLREDIAGDLKRWGLHKRKDRLDINEPTPLTAMLRYALERIGVSAPLLYTRTDGTGLLNGNTDPPSMIVGGDMLTGRNQRELAFMVSRATALMRPEFYFASAYPATDHLKIFFFAALALYTGALPGDLSPEQVQQINTLVDALRRAPEPVVLQIRNTVQSFLNEGRNPDLSKWLRGVDHTASRIGLLLCGDLRQAIASIKNDPMPIGKANVKDKVLQLILFSISDDYFRLRRDLGLALQAK